MTCVRLLAETGQADITMAPAADMFEMGVEVQVLKRGHDVRDARCESCTSCTRQYESGWMILPAAERVETGEDGVFKRAVRWTRCGQQTQCVFLAQRDPKPGRRVRRVIPRHKMALVFPFVPGAGVWAGANAGQSDRAKDRLSDLVRSGDGRV